MEERHFCESPIKISYGDMSINITQCAEDEESTLWLENESEDGSVLDGVQVNFCPFCGYEAKVKISEGVL